MSKKAILRACKQIGGQTALARELGLRSQGSVSNWIARGRVPPAHVLKIEEKTGVSRSLLRPDLYPNESNA